MILSIRFKIFSNINLDVSDKSLVILVISLMEYFRLMMFGLYFIQGMFYGYVYSLPLAYSNVPNYSILGLFAAAALPFSFKFIIGNKALTQHP